MSWRLGELLRGIVAARLDAAARDSRVSGVFDDSRRVRPGGLFVAVRGTRDDGRRHVGEALARGATVVVGEGLATVDGALAIDVPDARLVLARLAARWYGLDATAGHPLRLAAVTGTNGKTTTALLTQAIVQAAGEKCGLIGTVHHDLVGQRVEARHTTPGALELAAHLRACLDHGARFAVLEVSSHALDQERVAGLTFAAAAFTNLSGDHLDYHGSWEHYRASKARLFSALEPDATAVVNRDDPNAAEVVGATPARRVWYALDASADITAEVERASLDGTRYRLRVAGTELSVISGLIGRHNVYNALAAAGLAYVLGFPAAAVAAGLQSAGRIPGRLERVAGPAGVHVFVDYAHSDDALRRALETLRPLTRGRLILVFGCGGQRDRSKRPRMAAVAEQWADVIVVTSDNPRDEAPDAIIAEILAGFTAAARRRVIVEADRAAAIEEAIRAGRAGDVVLIAGKGHERVQIVGGRRVPFDDADVARRAAALVGPAVGEG